MMAAMRTITSIWAWRMWNRNPMMRLLVISTRQRVAAENDDQKVAAESWPRDCLSLSGRLSGPPVKWFGDALNSQQPEQ